MTKGVFEVNGIHHSTIENEKLLEYAAFAESASSHPISKSLQRAYGKEIDRSRVSDIQEISATTPSLLAPPIPAKKLKGILITSAQGQLMTSINRGKPAQGGKGR